VYIVNAYLRLMVVHFVIFISTSSRSSCNSVLLITKLRWRQNITSNKTTACSNRS